MKNKSRISSIKTATSLQYSITGFKSFNLSELNLNSDIDFQLSDKLSLGHLVETIVSKLIKLSKNYIVLHENIQVIEDKKTIGEIDFIIKETSTNKVIHLELAYKFYLYDPNISNNIINNWIDPNRYDSLKNKLEKLKSKQFPLLRHNITKSQLSNIQIEKVSQKLCLLASLFIPLNNKTEFSAPFKKAVRGYYLNFETLNSRNHSEKSYYIPTKKEWGINPNQNDCWHIFDDIRNTIKTSLNMQQSLLC